MMKKNILFILLLAFSFGYGNECFARNKSKKNKINKKNINNSNVINSEYEKYSQLKNETSIEQFKKMWNHWHNSATQRDFKDDSIKQINTLKARSKQIIDSISELKFDLQSKKKRLKTLKQKKPKRRKDRKKLMNEILELENVIANDELVLKNKITKYDLIKKEIDKKERNYKKQKRILKEINLAKSEIQKSNSIKNLKDSKMSEINRFKNAINQLIEFYNKNKTFTKAQFIKFHELIVKLSEINKKYSGINSKTFVKANNKGIVFKVQIAATKSENKINSLQNSSLEIIKEGETTHYILGTFENYWDANTFKNSLKDILGLTNDSKKLPFIVVYKNGKKITFDKKILKIIKDQKKS